jgi:D-sedoheptulose 7-phosphate isomerase
MKPAFVSLYQETLISALHAHDWTDVARLSESLEACWKDDRQTFICGNGGSAANAMHLANDFLYGIDKPAGRGLRVAALAANSAVLTCLANDVDYAEVFSRQLVALARPGDILIALSGSGNSANIVRALETAKQLGLTSFAILGYSGGKSLKLADHPIHFPIDDMQVAEDLQMIVGHMVMQSLSGRRSTLCS